MGPKSIELGEKIAITSFFFHSQAAFNPCAKAVAVCLTCAKVYDRSVTESTSKTSKH